MRSTVKVPSSSMRGRENQPKDVSAKETSTFIDEVDFEYKAREASSRRKRTITFGAPITKPFQATPQPLKSKAPPQDQHLLTVP